MSGEKRRAGEIGSAVAAGFGVESESLRCRACLTCSETYKKVSRKKRRGEIESNFGKSYGIRANQQPHNEASSDEFMTSEAKEHFLWTFKSCF